MSAEAAGFPKSKTGSQPRPYFIIAAGAGGSLPADKEGEPPRSIKTLLANIGDVDGPVPKLAGGAGGGQSNLSKHQDYVEAACAGPAKGREVFLVGQSFGGRCAVHLALGGLEDRTPPSATIPWADKRPFPTEIKGMIAFGYPLFHSKQDRAAPLLELPVGTRCSLLATSRPPLCPVSRPAPGILLPTTL
eukprot:SAG11_NODE_5544_length_1530_cov_1.982530_3_plen_189_part_01